MDPAADRSAADLPINLAEYETRARGALSSMAYDYYASGATDELTLADNQEAFRRRKLRYRVLAGVGQRSSAGELFGAPFAAPILIPPMAFQGLAHADAELGMARAARSAGTIMTLSTLSNVAIEEVAAATDTLWFQLYVYKDREATAALVRRAEAAGCQALVLTVDAPLLGRRERDVRNRFHLPEGLEAKNLHGAGYERLDAADDDSGLSAYVASLLDPNLRWEDLAWLKEITSLPILLKGVVRADDALRAVDAGADGLIVSNHGGRQLDTSIATIDALAEIAPAVGDALPLLLDGGVRRGTDVLKALALGARAVLVGRPLLYALAVGGQAGVEHALGLLQAEFDQAMALAGCRSLGEITSDLVAG